MFSLSSQDTSRENAENRSSRQNQGQWITNATSRDANTETETPRRENESRNESEFGHNYASNSDHERDEDNSEDDSSGTSVPDWDLLVAGYRACAEEAIRFLVEDENLPSSHPLVRGLWQHLSERQAILDVADILGSADEPRSSADDSAIELSVNLTADETSVISTDDSSRDLNS